MNKKIIACQALFLFVAALSGYAQKPMARSTVFTSVYTRLGARCKVIKGGPGTDDAELCSGPAGYQIGVFSSAATTNIVAVIKGKDDTFPLALVSIFFDESKTRVEWRLADGKPFAAIIRLPKYGPATTDDPYFGKVVGEQLRVIGLKGHEKIDASVDAKTSDANIKARQIADSSFSAGQVTRVAQ